MTLAGSLLEPKRGRKCQLSQQLASRLSLNAPLAELRARRILHGGDQPRQPESTARLAPPHLQIQFLQIAPLHCSLRLLKERNQHKDQRPPCLFPRHWNEIKGICDLLHGDLMRPAQAHPDGLQSQNPSSTAQVGAVSHPPFFSAVDSGQLLLSLCGQAALYPPCPRRSC